MSIVIMMQLCPSRSISTSSNDDHATASPTTTPIATAANGRTVFVHLPSSILILIHPESIASIGEGRTSTYVVISSVAPTDMYYTGCYCC
mmetsp:Transcript_11796/g.12850  ORF Transcript_11796/g.12850 Transcript_11796/m.12850 type:complete len:90 (+) Transcript_11796:182-451(+)